MTNDCLTVSIFVFGIWTFCWYSVAAECRQKSVEYHDVCSTETYGTVISTQTVTDQMYCSYLCLRTGGCLSHTYDTANGNCALNSGFLGTFPGCDINVKYGQMEKYECHTSGAFHLCGFDIHAVPGKVTGYVRVTIGDINGTVCDDGWEETSKGPQNAHVFCKSLGYSGGDTVYPHGSESLYNHEAIMMDDVNCAGTETNILLCLHSLTHNCGHSEDVRVICTV